MMTFKPVTAEIKNLLLDPNNYRFLDNPDYKKRLANRYHDDSVQKARRGDPFFGLVLGARLG